MAVFAGLRGPARTFTYSVPADLEVAPGHLVRVTLGSRAVPGVLIRVGVPPVAGMRDVEDLAHPEPVLSAHQLALARWIADRYRAGLADTVRAMVPPGLAARSRARLGVVRARRSRRVPLELALTEDDAVRGATLTAAQEAALAEIVRSMGTGGAPFLLHGVTGSGKTEVYLRAAAAALERGRGVIVLVPEIALTTQVVARFVARFGERVALLHSALSQGERYDEWRRVLDGT
ncbi:MAG TPA: DEAD/DEAH box helicase, partial [Gemmatimonadaceae bacterium]